LRLLRGEEGEVAPGVRWARTPGHTAGGVTYAVDTRDGVVVLCGDVVGPGRERFDAMEPEPGPDAADLLAAWQRIRSFEPALVVAGHLPPFVP
jgi:glyoxylase-like metal-dependent hydrolase (beta-lactamase superfamily II)